MHKIIHQIINNTIPDHISVGYLGGDDDETIIKPPICLTTPRTSKPTASVWPIQPTTLQSQPSQPDSQPTEEENTNPQPQVQPIDLITIPDIQPSPPPQNPIEVITISDDSLQTILTGSCSSLTNLTGILAKRKRSNFWLKIEGMFN